jgi:hypothetical protein
MQIETAELADISDSHNITTLWDDILLHIFAYTDIVAICRTCKYWRNLVLSSGTFYYEQLMKQQFPTAKIVNSAPWETIYWTHLNQCKLKSWHSIETLISLTVNREIMGRSFYFPSFAVDVAIYSGQYYYEVFIQCAGLMQIG